MCVCVSDMRLGTAIEQTDEQSTKTPFIICFGFGGYLMGHLSIKKVQTGTKMKTRKREREMENEKVIVYIR